MWLFDYEKYRIQEESREDYDIGLDLIDLLWFCGDVWVFLYDWYVNKDKYFLMSCC